MIDTKTGPDRGAHPERRPAAREQLLEGRQAHLPREHRLGLHARRTIRIFDATKGERVFEIIDASNWQVLKKIDMGKKLDEFGEPDMSGAVRPMALSPDEHFVYFQVSFFHGFVEYDLQQDRVTRLAHLPLSDEAKSKRARQYLLDSAHHGLAMNPAGTAAVRGRDDVGLRGDRGSLIVRLQRSRRTGTSRTGPPTRSDGSYCFVSFSGDDAVSVISYRKRRGDRPHPGGRPPAADADGQGPRRLARHQEALDTGARSPRPKKGSVAKHRVALGMARRSAPMVVKIASSDVTIGSARKTLTPFTDAAALS